MHSVHADDRPGARPEGYNSLVRPVVPFPFRVSCPLCEESGRLETGAITVVVLLAVEHESLILMAPTCAVLLATRHGLTAAWKHAMEEC